MAGEDPLRLVRLVTVPDSFEAKVIAARLGADGVVWELRGGIDGPYPMGPVHVFVLQRDLERAREVLDTPPLLVDDDLASGVHQGERDDVDDAPEPQPTRRHRPVVASVLVIGTLVLMAAWAVGRVWLDGG